MITIQSSPTRKASAKVLLLIINYIDLRYHDEARIGCSNEYLLTTCSFFTNKKTLQRMIHKVWTWKHWVKLDLQFSNTAWPSFVRSKFMQRSRICNDVKCSLGKILSSSAHKGHLLLKKSFVKCTTFLPLRNINLFCKCFCSLPKFPNKL